MRSAGNTDSVFISQRFSQNHVQQILLFLMEKYLMLHVTNYYPGYKVFLAFPNTFLGAETSNVQSVCVCDRCVATLIRVSEHLFMFYRLLIEPLENS